MKNLFHSTNYVSLSSFVFTRTPQECVFMVAFYCSQLDIGPFFGIKPGNNGAMCGYFPREFPGSN